MKISRRGFFKLALGGALVGTSGFYLLSQNPELQGPKRKYLSFLSIDEDYEQPTTKVDVKVKAVKKLPIENSRETIEDRTAELIITKSDNISEYYPGGILLSKNETRKSNIFGKYCSYDPSRTKESVEEILDDAKINRKMVLIYDEGEGGFVPRIGTLPAAEDIGNYYLNNKLEGTILGRVRPSREKTEREDEVRRLFREYAKELNKMGVDVVLGPVLDVAGKKDYGNLIKKDKRAFSNLYSATRSIVKIYINEMHEYGIKVSGKHFLSAGLPPEGDVHEEEVVQTKKIAPKIRASNLYERLKHDLDAVIVTHIGNPSDNNTPYSVSERSIDFLTKESYADKTNGGINFNGLVIADDLSMEAILDYANRFHPDGREKILLEGCETQEAKAAVLALNAGAHSLIAVSADVDAIVRGIVHAYNSDQKFRRKVELAIVKYQEFTGK